MMNLSRWPANTELFNTFQILYWLALAGKHRLTEKLCRALPKSYDMWLRDFDQTTPHVMSIFRVK
jgi:hypothetical protein